MEANTKKKVISKMKENGIINHIRAHYISLISQASQGEDNILKSYPNLKKTISYKIATMIVFQYLKEKSMKFSLNSAESEINNSTDFKNESIIKQLGINTEGVWVHELITDCNLNKSEILEKNQSFNDEKINEFNDESLNSMSSDEFAFETDQIEFSDISSNGNKNGFHLNDNITVMNK